MPGEKGHNHSEDESFRAAMVAAQTVKARYEEVLMRKANVVGVGIGLKQRGGEVTHQPALIVNVTQKVALEYLAPEDRIPPELDGVPVDVQAIGVVRIF